MAGTITFEDEDGVAHTLSFAHPLPVTVTATSVSADAVDTEGADEGDVLTVVDGESAWAPAGGGGDGSRIETEDSGSVDTASGVAAYSQTDITVNAAGRVDVLSGAGPVYVGATGGTVDLESDTGFQLIRVGTDPAQAMHFDNNGFSLELAGVGGVSRAIYLTQNGGFAIPSGSTANRPSTPQNGALYLDTEIGSLLYALELAWIETSTGLPPV